MHTTSMCLHLKNVVFSDISPERVFAVPYPRGGTWSGKGYQLRSDRCGAVAVAAREGLKKGGCPLIIL